VCVEGERRRKRGKEREKRNLSKGKKKENIFVCSKREQNILFTLIRVIVRNLEARGVAPKDKGEEPVHRDEDLVLDRDGLCEVG